MISPPPPVSIPQRPLVVIGVSLALVASLVAPSLAAGSDARIHATGVLRSEVVAVSADPGLAALYPDATATNTARMLAKAARAGGARPAGRLVWFGPALGGSVAAGGLVARIDRTGGDLALRRADAEVQVAEANVGLVEDARSKLLDAEDKLLDARAKLRDARGKARATYDLKRRQGEAAGRTLASTVAGLGRRLGALKAKLAAARAGLAQALAALAQAEALPDTDPAKPSRVAAAQAAVAQAHAGVAALTAATRKLSAGLAAARAGLAKLGAGLATGAAGFAAAMAKVQAALSQMASALDKIEEQYRVLGHRLDAGRAYVRSVRARRHAVAVLAGSHEVRAPISGTLVSQKVQVGQLVFAGQPIAEIAPKGRLRLDLYVPLDQVRALGPGEQASVAVDGVSDAFAARVHLVAWTVDLAPTDVASEETHLMRTVRVELDVTDLTGVLKPGMLADADVGGPRIDR